MLLLSQSVVLSKQADSNRDLVQTVALLEFRLRELEETVHAADGDRDVSAEITTTEK